MSATFPDKHYFLNNEANRMLFLAQFPNEKTAGTLSPMNAAMLDTYSNMHAYKCQGGAFLFSDFKPTGMSEYIFQPSFPEKHWFLNTAENRKLFVQQFPNEKWCDGDAVTEEGLAGYDGKYIGNWEGVGLVHSSCLDTSFSGHTEYTFTPPMPQFPTKPKVFPHGRYFLNTPANLMAFEREFPGMGWNTIGDHPTPALTVMLRCGEYAFAYHDVSRDGKTQYAFTAYSMEECETNGLIRHYFTHERDTVSLVELAKKCVGKRTESIEHKTLSLELNADGYTHLAKAVLGGSLWAEEIAKGKSLSELEKTTSTPSWSWNSRPDTAPTRDLEVGEYITVAQGRLADACREFSNVGEYCKGNEYPAEANSKVPLGFANLDGKIKWDRCDPWVFREKDLCKEVKWAGSATISSWAAATSEDFVASPEKPKLTNCCFRNTRANVEEFMRRFPDVKSAACRTARDMYSCDPMYEYLSVDDMGVLCLAIGPHRPLLDLTPAASPSVCVPAPLAIVTNEALAKRFQQYAKAWQHPKPSRAKRILAYCLSPAKVWAQNITFLCAVGGIGYGGWKAYEWAKENAPTIKWEPKQEVGK